MKLYLQGPSRQKELKITEAEVYKSLFGASLSFKDKVENQSFLAVNVKKAQSWYPNSADPYKELICFFQ